MGKPITGHWELLYPSKYLKAADLRGKDVTLVVDHVEWEKLVMSGGKADLKVTISIRTPQGRKIDKRWVVGKTNLRSIASVTGETDVAKWAGKSVTLYPTTCSGQRGDTVECIRVRPRVGRDNGEPPAEVTAAVEMDEQAIESLEDEAPADEVKP